MQDRLQITPIGHATCLLQTSRGALLTDPHFGRRVLWWPRVAPLTYPLGQLPKLAGILISHAHYDHLDIESFKYLPSRVPVIVPPGMGRALYRFVNNPVIEVAHWVPHQLGDGLTITPVPVRHFGGRMIPNLRYRNNSGYLIAAGARTIYFAGDTTYGTHFREVGNLYTIDAALLPVEALAPKWWPFARGLNGLEALQAFTDLKARHLIPIHWGSFGAPKVWERALTQLERHMHERQMTDQWHRLTPGQTWAMQ